MENLCWKKNGIKDAHRRHVLLFCFFGPILLSINQLKKVCNRAINNMEENQFHCGQTSIHYHPLGFSVRLFFDILGILNLIHQLYSKYYPLMLYKQAEGHGQSHICWQVQAVHFGRRGWLLRYLLTVQRICLFFLLASNDDWTVHPPKRILRLNTGMQVMCDKPRKVQVFGICSKFRT